MLSCSVLYICRILNTTIDGTSIVLKQYSAIVAMTTGRVFRLIKCRIHCTTRFSNNGKRKKDKMYERGNDNKDS